MPTLYVTEQGAVVRLSGLSLLVTLEIDPDGSGPLPPHRSVLLEVEPHRLESIALVGRIHMTRAAVHLCLEQGIDVSWFSWNGRFLGRLVSESSRNGSLRIAQYEAATSPERRLEYACNIVAAKIANSGAVLKSSFGNGANIWIATSRAV